MNDSKGTPRKQKDVRGALLRDAAEPWNLLSLSVDGTKETHLTSSKHQCGQCSTILLYGDGDDNGRATVEPRSEYDAQNFPIAEWVHR
jgi:hypothetical protein